MIKKAFLVVLLVVAVLAAVGAVLYSRNVAPVVPAITSADAANPAKPYVVKMHAQWCAVCMVTKDEWSQIERAYAGRVNLVVLDFTNEQKTEASRAEAARLGLQKFYDEYSGATGMIVVIDGRTKDVMTSIIGSRDFAEYRRAIDAALQSSESVGSGSR